MGEATGTTTATVAGTGTTYKRLRSLKEKNCEEVPQWVLAMINIMQYKDCETHFDVKENKLDRFCIDCVKSFCNKCSSNHHGHKCIKIRRYVYCDVINRPEIQKHFDCSGIQGYQTNRVKVVFLKRRRAQQQDKEQQQQNQNMRDHNCVICNQSLMDSLYCSIQCKVSAVYKTENTEEASVENNICNNKGEGSENGLHYAKEGPMLVLSKRRRPRKGVPCRAPLF